MNIVINDFMYTGTYRGHLVVSGNNSTKSSKLHFYRKCFKKTYNCSEFYKILEFNGKLILSEKENHLQIWDDY